MPPPPASHGGLPTRFGVVKHPEFGPGGGVGGPGGGVGGENAGPTGTSAGGKRRRVSFFLCVGGGARPGAFPFFGGEGAE